MEISLQSQTPFLSRQTTPLKFRPFSGLLSYKPSTRSSQSYSCHLEYSNDGVFRPFSAAGDFSRKRSRKWSTARSKGPSPKGFVPKAPVGTGLQKKDQRNDEENSTSINPPSELGSRASDAGTTSAEREVSVAQQVNIIEEQGEGASGTNGNVGEPSPTKKAVSLPNKKSLKEHESIRGFTEERKSMPSSTVANEKEEEDLFQEHFALMKGGSEDNVENLTETLRKLDLEREELMRKQVIHQLAQVNFSKGNKIFIYPEIVKPDEEIEVFLNRSISTLKDQSDVIIMGAFNDWRWKSFTIKLEKAHLNGDWWSCRIHVPKEAYTIDFVFFDGKDIYDNNDKKDFHITVEGGMDMATFEDFLLEEKRRELEELARVQTERERQAEEQKRREEEKAAMEADRAQAREEVQQRREKLTALIKFATLFKENVWYFEPRDFQDGDLVRLFYKKSSGPLAEANELWVHGGHDGWVQGVSVVSRLVESEGNADWWYAEVIVPDKATVLDWVFANGPPQKASLYDNNNFLDFHAIVPKSVPTELYWIEEEQRIYQRLQQERRLREEAARVKAEKTARIKADTKERTLKTFLLSQRHIVYTDPVDIKAGQDVTVYYNPCNTVLNGKPEVWFRGSFNRWTHRRGPLSPQKMLPAENGSHVKTNG